MENTAGLSQLALRSAQFEALTSGEREVHGDPDGSHARIEYRLAIKKSMTRWAELGAMGTQGPYRVFQGGTRPRESGSSAGSYC